MLSAKSRKAWRWSSAVGPVSSLYLGSYFKYPAGNASRLVGKTKATHLACKIVLNAIIVGGVWGVWEDEEEQD